MRAVLFLFILTSGLLTQAMLLRAIAQVTSDGTTNTIVNSNSNNYTILNGIAKGNNLFHSFNNFSVPTGGSATFNLMNTPNITTIFSRVTGGNVSNIDGLISTLNSSNPVSLFLMNPAGIVFGANARLNIGSSFLGTTANSINFADGTEFSAVNPTATPLLTISVPIGLQLGQKPGGITVQNTGHRLIAGFTPIKLGKTPTGLSVTTGNTLALIGGSITLDGGVLQAPSGQIELGSASTGTVNLNLSTGKFDYANIQQFGDIQLSNQALANASGAPSGSIHFQGRNISFTGGSGALLVNQGNKEIGDIVINASELLEMRGVGTFGFAQNFLRSDNAGTGVGGDLVVSAPRVQFLDGGTLASRNFGAGTGGSIFVTAADSLDLIGFSPIGATASALTTNTFGSGRAGDIQVSTGTLRVQAGGIIVVTSTGIGAGGNSNINASKSIELSGENPLNLSSSGIMASAGSSGNAGQITVSTRRLNVQDGAIVGNSTVASGNSGNLVVNVSDSIEVSGVGAQSGVSSRLVTNAEIRPDAFRQQFGLPPFPTGTVGDLTINTSRLQITDRGTVGVEHQGIGNAGNLYVNAESIVLDRAGSITAATKSGEGGNVNLQVNTLVMRHGSNVTATAGGTGNGGNILINSPIILGLENSDIIANAFQGNGGNINITTQGIFGLKYRDRLTRESDITASSQFGVSGTVEVNTIGVDPNSGLVELPANVTDPSQQIATGCGGREGSRFVATGRGGIPENPTQQVMSDRTWDDVRDLSAYRKTGEVTAQMGASPEMFVQATSWHRNANGKVELIALQSPANVQPPLTCAALVRN
ncbi:MAG: filamentous hemagglutinin N-terminal domain-containing protein [Nostoc sp. NOS(2021)]|uniref:two-partner secretion domain-containing protein n=1 Tax=Nostoc sp. NOS(2021) TaxID=2815407 RepID=UPI0026011CA8|nr:filamentous hemagglutinin N-terminal domain-containing protein [Nostoc sp. NOS(2021)]MBN3898007.1 filamentous hemagglutinin N-terminal domain-containing protein [Nostoc sp. NOS(2021)]